MLSSNSLQLEPASGLFEPFISHLKSAKDEIFKGGYSIKLRPPNHGAPWFTKATFQRFVRFVSTPAVLERFVSIEKEILQIESSVQVNESNIIRASRQSVEGSFSAANGSTKKSADSSKIKCELGGMDDGAKEENSKVHLQRLLDTRKTLLRKEQAMAYARGIVAGFEMDNVDDLISFADAFGALRLREACVNFKELCKKKHADGLWMEELAAMKACSPSELSFMGTSAIVLTNEISAHYQRTTSDSSKDDASTCNLLANGFMDTPKSRSSTSHACLDSKRDNNASDQTPSTTAKVQFPMPWQNQIPQYMYNFQIPIQQIPPYQRHPFPLIQSVPPHYPKNMQWPPNMDKSSNGLVRQPNYRNNKTTSAGRKPNKNEPEYSGDGGTESSDSDSGSYSHLYLQRDRQHSSREHPKIKTHRKKSSRTVVIPNINYISPKGRDGKKGSVSDESTPDEELINGENGVRSLEKFHEPNSCDYKKIGLDKGGYNLNQTNNSTNKDNELNIREVGKLQPINVQDEHFRLRSSEGETSFTARPAEGMELEKAPKRLMAAADSLVVTERMGGNDARAELEDFENGENSQPFMNRRDCANEELLFSQRIEESRTYFGNTLSTCSAESTIIKIGRMEDLFTVNHSGMSENQDLSIKKTFLDGVSILSLEGDFSHTKKSIIGKPIDDSFMIETRPAVDHYDSQWKTDISMETDITLSAFSENGTSDISHVKHEISNTNEPDDLCVVLERDSRLESAEVSWTMDYGINISFTEANRRGSVVEASDHLDKALHPNCKSSNSNSKETTESKNPGKEARSKALRGSLGMSKSEIVPKSKKPFSVSRLIVQKSKLEKEEEIRKKMEEQLIQRQKRIAERTAASGFSPSTSKKAPSKSKGVKGSFKSDKNNIHSTTHETNRIGPIKVTAS
ncbi:COP1-interacting protein 7 isoform X2 [Quercus robur]|uniref:COP1-interacting protein 7 isoform X2 n=1 Tax=Quercus robur TaxID=38942 RepID=UPI002162DB63|nr:COP1-interacting protein 7 isoform X2 [Quercus robur]